MVDVDAVADSLKPVGMSTVVSDEVADDFTVEHDGSEFVVIVIAARNFDVVQVE